MKAPVREPGDMIPVQEHAFGIAVAYDAYQDARKVPREQRTYIDWNGIAVWAGCLIRHQEFFGIEIIPKVTLESEVIEARKAKAEIKEIDRPAIEAPY